MTGVRFLVVEDHEVQRRLLIRILANLGADAIQDAEDGHAALRVMGDSVPPIDVLVTDLSMPGMDGVELIRHVGEGGSSVSIILTSSLEPRLLASVANMAQAYNVKLLGVVRKPPSAGKLAPLLEQYLANPQAPRQGGSERFSLAAIAEAFVNDEFEAWFEPIVSLSTLKVAGMQASPVWRHPTRGDLPAHEFLPAITAYGLGDDIAWLLLRKCAQQSAAWKQAGLAVKIEVPLDVESLGDLELAGRVEKVVLREGAETGSLVLGIPAAAVEAASARALENLVRLRMLGFELAIDRFGSGTGSVEPLTRAAFNALKIGRSFVTAGTKGGGPWGGLVRALDVAQQLKLVAVAEGIATPDDWNQLQELQCPHGQGPLIAQPMPGGAVASWLDTWPPQAQRGVWTPAPLL